MSQANTNLTLTMQEYSFLEALYRDKKIDNYTYDGWIQLGTEWVPTSTGLKQIGVLNEYYEQCGQHYQH